MAVTVTLKRCPHCGGRGSLRENYSAKMHSYFVFVRCDVCGSQGAIYNTETQPSAVNWNDLACFDAVMAWNLRSNEQEG